MQPWILALIMRVLGYVLLTIGIAVTPFDGACIVVGAGCVIEGLLAEREIR